MSDARADSERTNVPAAEVVERLLTEIGTGPKAARRHIEGFGTLFLRGRTWWVRYSDHGRRREESSKSADERVALKLLRKRVQEIGKGRRLNPVAEERVRMSDLFKALETDYKNNGRRSVDTLAFRLKPLRAAFDNDRARDVTSARIADYVRDRLAAKKAAATVNRELAALRRAFALAVEHERLSAAPRIRLLSERNVRQGFVSPAEFEKILDALPEHLRDVARFGFLTGWRRSEILKLEWKHVHQGDERITLPGELSKNGQPRTIPFVGSLAEIIARRLAVRGASVHVFHRNGKPIKDFRGAWSAACKAADRPGLLFHDLRRSAVRNLVSAGVDQSVAMRVTGHQTTSVFMRYRITTDADVRAALARTDAAINAARETKPADE
jgi:integrase